MPGQDSAIKDLTKTFDLPRGIDRQLTPNALGANHRPGRQAGKARGAVPGGQEFVSANLPFHRW
jgi:hypothetical protein